MNKVESVVVDGMITNVLGLGATVDDVVASALGTHSMSVGISYSRPKKFVPRKALLLFRNMGWNTILVWFGEQVTTSVASAEGVGKCVKTPISVKVHGNAKWCPEFTYRDAHLVSYLKILTILLVCGPHDTTP